MTHGDHQEETGVEAEKRAFLSGIQLFNDGEFFEAHEAWEEAWNLATGPKARFYQGLIQAAVTLEHINRDNPRGVQKVWRSMLGKFAGMNDRIIMGVDVQALIDGLTPIVDPILKMSPRQGQQPGEVELPWNRSQVPKIALKYDAFATGEAESF